MSFLALIFILKLCVILYTCILRFRSSGNFINQFDFLHAAVCSTCTGVYQDLSVVLLRDIHVIIKDIIFIFCCAGESDSEDESSEDEKKKKKHKKSTKKKKRKSRHKKKR